jgi:isocitrate/isopropylmalate dehydrogenase
VITLEEAKRHLRVFHDGDDVEIQAMIEAATAAAADYLGAAIANPAPAPVRAAILLQVGDLYENREAGGQGAVAQYFSNPTYERLLNPYRVMAV